jgi:hemolysin III
MSIENAHAKVQPNDRGPIYKETDMTRLPVEPWSTFSNLIFLAVFIYFAVKTRFSYRKFPLMTIFLPILFCGWFGGTVYHATRSANIWLMMDYIPVMFLVLMASIYFWREVVGNWLLVFVFTLVPIISYRFIYEFISLPHSISISIGYSVLALIVIIPLVLHCRHKNPQGWKLLIAALVSFIFAITCRIFDNNGYVSFMPMGTHFLWHVFGGLCCFFMLCYIYKSEKIKNMNKVADKAE